MVQICTTDEQMQAIICSRNPNTSYNAYKKRGQQSTPTTELEFELDSGPEFELATHLQARGT